MNLSVLGCSGSTSYVDDEDRFHGTSAYLLESQQTRLLLDIGFGANAKLGKQGLREKIDALLITHAHGDHIGDLAALGQDLQYPKDEDGAAMPPFPAQIPVYGPAGIKEELDQATQHKGFPRPISGVFDFKTFYPAEPLEVGDLSVTLFPVDHVGLEAYAVRVDGTGERFAYSGDVGEAQPGTPSPGLLKAAQEADLALVEAFYLKKAEVSSGLHLSGHTAGQAAQAAGAGKVLLTHHHPNVSAERILTEAHATYSGPIQSAKQGTTYTVSGNFPAGVTYRSALPAHVHDGRPPGTSGGRPRPTAGPATSNATCRTPGRKPS
ncbi:MAG: MBL fold metallo-hydrolase [Corynebacteriales bacterium]|nr:MBL fold metallo-hydrolase [Mycobacteriales bacterium]